MDSTVIKIVNIPLYNNDTDEEPIGYRTVYLPTKIHSHTIEELHAKVGLNGKLFKNVSTLTSDKDKMYDIVGNFINENKRLFTVIKKIGY